MWCASEKMCISEDWICYGWGGCSDDGFDGEPDNCGKFMRENCPIFPFFSAHISHGKGKYLNQTVFLKQNLPRINFTETKFNFMGVTHRIQLT